MTDGAMGDDVSFESFCAAFRLFAQKAAKILQPIPIAPTTGWNITFSENTDQISMMDGLVAEPVFHIGNHAQLIKTLSEFSAIKEVVQGSVFLSKHIASDALSGTAFREDVFWQSLNAMLNRSLIPTFHYNETTVSTLLDSLKVEIAKPTTTYLIRAYFRPMGLQLDGPLVFANDAVIRPLTQDDIRQLVRDSKARIDDGPPATNALKFNSVLELRVESTDKNILLGSGLPRPLMDYQTALRLVVGQVAFAYATIERDSVIHSRFPLALVPYRKGVWQGDAFALLKPVPLKEHHVSRASEYLEYLVSSPNKDVLATGIRRFNDALERLRLDDAFLDCIIGLESILTHEFNTEILRRLRQRLSVMIGRSVNDRIAIDSMVPKLYDARSKIAHGDKPKTAVGGLFLTAEEYLSRLIRALLSAENKFSDVEVDRAIIRGDWTLAKPETWEM